MHPHLISCSWTHSNDSSLEDFGLCLFWNHDSTSGFGDCFSSQDENAVEQWN